MFLNIFIIFVLIIKQQYVYYIYFCLKKAYIDTWWWEMVKKTDLRVIKTKNLIYNTLIELMKDKTFEEIKVSDICNKALINRSTFYSHYEDKYDLLVDFINSLKDEFVTELNKNSSNLNTKEYYIELIKIFLNHIEERKEMYTSIMINNRNSIMMDILLSVVNNDLLKKMSKDEFKSSIPDDIIVKFYLGGVINLGVEWLKDNTKYSKEEIINYLNLLIPDNI